MEEADKKNSTSTSDMENQIMFIRQLSTDIMDELGQILEKDGSWKHIVRRLMDVNINLCSTKELEEEKFPSSPAKKLLRLLGNFKISDIYVTVATLKLDNVMLCIEHYVDAETRKKVEDARKQCSSKVVCKPSIQIAYIHQLPEDVRRKLCYVLDIDNSWEALSTRFENVGLDFLTLLQCRSERSPSNELLKLLGDRNFEISLLYVALASLDLSKAMSFLQSYVSEDLRDFIQSSLGKNQRHRDDSVFSNTVRSPHSQAFGTSAVKAKLDTQINSESEDDSNQSKETDGNGNTKGDKRFSAISYLELIPTRWNKEKQSESKIDGNFYRVTYEGAEVAIKRLRLKNEDKLDQLLEEVHAFRSVNHQNVLKMLNFIEGNGDPCLIYPFVKNGSLSNQLMHQEGKKDIDQNSCILSWQQNYNIACGVADALVYLHRHFKGAVILKSSDILLDDAMNPLVCDICFPCMFDDNPSDYLQMYLPRQAQTKRENLDTFCLGTILLELAMGKSAKMFHKHTEELLVEMRKKNSKLNSQLLTRNAAYCDIKTIKEWKALILLCSEETIQIECISRHINKELKLALPL